MGSCEAETSLQKSCEVNDHAGNVTKPVAGEVVVQDVILCDHFMMRKGV